jgi:hypothetical protein
MQSRIGVKIMARGPQKTTLRLKLEAMEIGETITLADDHEARKTQFISWELRKKLGRKFKREGLNISRCEDQETYSSSNAYFVVLYGIIGMSLEGPFDSKSCAVSWLEEYEPNEPGRNGEPEFGMVIGPVPTKMFREF